MNIIKERNAPAFLFLNAILWGSSYIWSKMLLDYLPYFTILFVFSIIGLTGTAAIFHKRIRNIAGKTVIKVAGIGCLSILSNICCMLALQGTSSSNTAFIVQLSVILTPLFMSAVKRKMPGGRTVFSAFAAFAGLLLLTCDFEHFSFNPGDLFALGNAVFFSLYLVALKLCSGKTDPVQFTFVQHAAGTAVFLGMALIFDLKRVDPGRVDMTGLAILLLSAVISVSTILIQSSAIRFVRPEKATIIYTLEPVTAAGFALVLTGERFAGFNALAGCLLIIFAVICSTRIRQPDNTQMKRNKVEYTYLHSVQEIRRKGA